MVSFSREYEGTAAGRGAVTPPTSPLCGPSGAGADRWTVASVGIAQAVTPKKPIPISPGNGEVSEKLVPEAEATGFEDPEGG